MTCTACSQQQTVPNPSHRISFAHSYIFSGFSSGEDIVISCGSAVRKRAVNRDDDDEAENILRQITESGQPAS